MTDENYFEGETTHYELDESAVHMVRDNNKCILAGDVLPSVKKCRA